MISSDVLDIIIRVQDNELALIYFLSLNLELEVSIILYMTFTNITSQL